MRLFYFSNILINHKCKDQTFLLSLIKRRSILFLSSFYLFVAQLQKISDRYKSQNQPLVLAFCFLPFHWLYQVIVLLFLSTKGAVIIEANGNVGLAHNHQFFYEWVEEQIQYNFILLNLSYIILSSRLKLYNPDFW